MIVGVGIDIFRVDRMRRELNRSDGFETYVFTADEVSSARRRPHPAHRLASVFAAKEAVVKALAGAETFGMLWRDIEVSGEETSPRIELSGRALGAAASLNVDDIRVAFSNTETEAVAMALAVSTSPPHTSNPGVSR